MTAGSVCDALLYGLRVRSELPLPGGRCPDDLAAEAVAPDLEVILGATIPSPAQPPPGEVIASHAYSDTLWYSINRQAAGGYLMRYGGTCDFVIDADLRRAEARGAEGTSADLLSVFASG